MTSWRPGIAAIVFIAIATAGVTACGSGGEESPVATDSTSTQESSTENDGEASEPSDDYQPADGANPINITGKPLFSLSEAGLRIDAYEAGRAKAAVDSEYVDSDSDKNVWPEGSDVVYVTYVLTNTSDKAVYINNTPWSVDLEIKSMPYFGGVEDVTPFDASEASSFGIFDKPFANVEGAIGDHAALPAGTSVAFSAALPLKKGEAGTFSATVPTYPSATAGITEGDSIAFGETTHTFK